MKSNCLFWAIAQKIKHGGFIKITKTPGYPFVPRTFWSLNKTIWYRFAPAQPVKNPTFFQKYFPFHVILFKGAVKRANPWV